MGGKLDLVRTFMVCIDGSTWFLKVVKCFFPSFFVVIFGALCCAFLGGVLSTISWEFCWVSCMRTLCLFGW
jgi:hypothetical protein